MSTHSDHKPYLKYTSKSRLDKAIKSLVGIIEGLTIDQDLNSQELAFFTDWIDQNRELRDRHPFNELLPLVIEIFEDHKVTEEELEDLKYLCDKFINHTDFYDQITSDIQRLHGVLGGVIADGVVTEKELAGLRDWLNDHEHLKSCWPYDEIDNLITAVMADGVIDDEEQTMLISLFADFLAYHDDKTITAPQVIINSSVTGLCAVCPEISFNDSTFCFTGASSKLKRSDFEKIVKDLGGIFSKNITKSVNYLVIGADGNPCWAYTCYGRKVELAVKLRKEGHKLMLIHENDFHDALADLR